MGQARTKRTTETGGWRLAPIIIAIGLIPLVVHAYAYDPGLSKFDWFPDGTGTLVDLFLGWKMIATVLTGLAAALVIAWTRAKRKGALSFHPAYGLLLSFGVLVVLSALFSDYKYQVVHGNYEMLEPLWAVLACLVLCCHASQAVGDERQAVRVFEWAAAGVCVCLAIGVFQFFGLDIFRAPFAKTLLSDPFVQTGDVNVSVQPGTVYMTLYNQDYVAFYVGLLLPVAAALFATEKSVLKRVLWGAVAAAGLLCLYGSRALSGWLGILASIVILALVLLSRRKKAFVAGLCVLAVCAIGGTAVLFCTDQGASLRTGVFGSYRQEDAYLVQGIETGEDEIVFDCQGEGLHVSYTVEDGGATFSLFATDDGGTSVAYTRDPSDPSTMYCSDGRFGDFSLSLLSQGEGAPPLLNVNIDGHDWQFVQGDGGYYYANPAGKCVKFPEYAGWGLFNEDAFSGRGHIWNCTLPLLGKHLILGSGANTFMLEFPQEDYLYRVYSGTQSYYDVKPHCWYLQLWVEEGGLATLLLVAFLLCYLVQSARTYRRVPLRKRLNLLGLGIFAGVLCYLVVALANDPTVNVAAMFWAFLGLGYAVNRAVARAEGLDAWGRQAPAAGRMGSAETGDVTGAGGLPQTGGGKVGADMGSVSSGDTGKTSADTKNASPSSAGSASSGDAGKASADTGTGNTAPDGNAPGKNTGTPGKQPSKKQKQSRKKKRGKK